jgi:hypothetical protein
MSHFVVLAFGENVDRMLEPYYEGIEVDEYYVGDVSEEEKDDFIEYYKEHLEKEGRPFQSGLSKEEEMETLYKEFGMDWNRDSWRVEGGIWCKYSTYNPLSKWDWYTIGGRFEDFFKLKPDAYTKPVLTISDIDFFGKAEENKKKAEEDWENVNKVFNEANTGNFKSWKEILEMENLTIDKQRVLYHKQPEVEAYMKYLEEDSYMAFYEKLEDYLVSKEEFVDARIYGGVVPYAYVSEKTGWREKGEMGWFGMSNDKYSDKEWFKEFMEFITSLPLDTPVSIVDCHI